MSFRGSTVVPLPGLSAVESVPFSRDATRAAGDQLQQLVAQFTVADDAATPGSPAPVPDRTGGPARA